MHHSHHFNMQNCFQYDRSRGCSLCSAGVTANKGISGYYHLTLWCTSFNARKAIQQLRGKEWSSILIQHIRTLLLVTIGDKKQRLQLQSRYHGPICPTHIMLIRIIAKIPYLFCLYWQVTIIYNNMRPRKR